MTWKDRSVLVTGAGGFIGSHLVERLAAEGAAVKAFVRYTSHGSRGWLEDSPMRERVAFHRGDIRDADSVREAMRDVDCIFHLAALIGIPYSYHAPRSYVDTNVTGTLNVLQAARDLSPERVVVTSTSEVYGTARTVPIHEDHALQGQSPYSASKIGADKIAESFHLSFGLPVVIARPFNTYGPRQSARAIIPSIIAQALSPNIPQIRIGNLSPTRDLTHVSDTVDAFLAVASSKSTIGQTVHWGTGREVSVGDLARLIQEAVGSAKPVVEDAARVRAKGTEVERLLADAGRIAALAGWRPRHTLESGLKETVSWMREHSDLYRPEEYAL